MHTDEKANKAIMERHLLQALTRIESGDLADALRNVEYARSYLVDMSAHQATSTASSAMSLAEAMDGARYSGFDGLTNRPALDAIDRDFLPKNDQPPLSAHALLAYMLARPPVSWVATISDVALAMSEMGRDPGIVWRNGAWAWKDQIITPEACKKPES
jgi:hypothetical protein